MFKLGELLKDHIEAGSSAKDSVESQGSTTPDNSGKQESDNEMSEQAGEPTNQASTSSEK